MSTAPVTSQAFSTAFSPRSSVTAGPMNLHSSLQGTGTNMAGNQTSSRGALSTNRGGIMNVMTSTTTASNDMFSPRGIQKNNFIQGKADEVLREHGAAGS